MINRSLSARLILAPLTLAAAALLAAGVQAQGETKPAAAPATTAAAPAAKMEAKAGTTTLKGEVVDTGCYLGHGARGAKHKGCAVKCAKGGMPLGLVTDDGTVYLLVPNHDNMEPFKQANTLIAATVEVSGAVLDKGGMKAIEMNAVKKVEDAK